MTILLDTNAVLWQLGWTNGREKLGKGAKRLLEQADKVYVSSISLVEMHIKTMLGKFDAPENTQRMIENAGESVLDFSAGAADALRDFPSLARHDPFDRMLLAQAKSEGLVFVTADHILLQLGLDFVVDARA